ncbi:hypothetical protein ACVQ9Z_10380 [Staphylococcus aureus]
MKITNCKIKRETVIYEVLTSGNQPFTYELPKDLSSHNARKYLEFISQKLDGDKLTRRRFIMILLNKKTPLV